jgi:hypothetical protein
LSPEQPSTMKVTHGKCLPMRKWSQGYPHLPP